MTHLDATPTFKKPPKYIWRTLYVNIFYVLKITKKETILAPPPPSSAYVIYEWSLPQVDNRIIALKRDINKLKDILVEYGTYEVGP